MKCQDKRRFDSRELADERLKQITLDESKNKKPIRIYHCDCCKGFHLTSWTKSKKRYLQSNNKQRRLYNEVVFFAKRNNWNLDELI